MSDVVADTADTATVGESLYRRIRNDVIFGRLAPGQKLTLDRMRESYGTSIGTLREVLHRLSSEGFIIAEASRGFEVTPTSVTNLQEVAAMRQLLECHALRDSFQSGDIEWEGRVVSAHHKLASMEKRMQAGDRSHVESWKRYDRAFHQALISACGSSVLLEMHGVIYDRYLRYLILADVFRAEATAEHQKLLECALARDWKAAQATLVSHVQDCVNHVIDKRLVQ